VNTVKVAPVICYESIYGEYVASYVKKGATLITILPMMVGGAIHQDINNIWLMQN
jgi:predicted amidohydrolase